MNPRRYQPDESILDGATAPGLAKPGSAFEATPSIVDGTMGYQLPEFAPSLVELSVGQLIGGRYEVLSRIGAGGMGEVYKVQDRQLNRRVSALKRIKPEFAGNKTLLDRFCQEAFAVAALNHPHIVHLYELEKSVPYLTLEYVDGGDLVSWLKANGPMSVEMAVPLVIDLCDALNAAHTHPDGAILHRDVKPANVLLAKGRGGQWLAKLCDFGLASLESVDGHTQSGSVLGTWDYMAPEQLRSSTHCSPRSDQWSLAATLFTLVTDRSPRTDLLDLDDLAEPLRSILRRALRSDPAKRFGTLVEFAEALGECVGRRTQTEQPDSSSTTRPVSKASPPPTDWSSMVQAMQAKVNSAHEEAQRLIEVEHDYAAAVEVLSEVPEHLRKADLLRVATARRDRVAELNREIDQRARELRLRGMQPLIAELLDLQPERDELHRLLETVQAAEPAVAVSASRPALLKAPFGPSEIDESRAAWSQYLGQPIEITNSIGMKLLLIPPGEFLMGSSDADVAAAIKAGADSDWVKNEQPQHRVRITQPFYAGAFAITQKEWQTVVGNNPSNFKGDRRPVEQVSWDDVTSFCAKLSGQSGEQSSCRTYRLPSEAEWEYFCRAGTTTPYWFGSVLNGKQANVNGNYPYGTSEKGPYLQQTCDVGKYAANPFGLFDVHGNVFEWCRDWFNDTYYKTSSEVEDPVGPSSGENRVVRGGSWSSDCRYARSAFRFRYTPGNRNLDIGGRVVSPALRQDS